MSEETRTYELKIKVIKDEPVEDALYDFDGTKPANYSFLNFLKDLIEKGIPNGDKGVIHWILESVTDET